jgi:hypothetical protein
LSQYPRVARASARCLRSLRTPLRTVFSSRSFQVSCAVPRSHAPHGRSRSIPSTRAIVSAAASGSTSSSVRSNPSRSPRSMASSFDDGTDLQRSLWSKKLVYRPALSRRSGTTDDRILPVCRVIARSCASSPGAPAICSTHTVRAAASKSSGVVSASPRCSSARLSGVTSGSAASSAANAPVLPCCHSFSANAAAFGVPASAWPLFFLRRSRTRTSSSSSSSRASATQRAASSVHRSRSSSLRRSACRSNSRVAARTARLCSRSRSRTPRPPRCSLRYLATNGSGSPWASKVNADATAFCESPSSRAICGANTAGASASLTASGAVIARTRYGRDPTRVNTQGRKEACSFRCALRAGQKLAYSRSCTTSEILSWASGSLSGNGPAYSAG